MLKATIDELTRRFSAQSVGASGRQRLRERAEDLLSEVLAALASASLGEIAEVRRTLDRRRKNRVVRPTARHAMNGKETPGKRDVRALPAPVSAATAAERVEPVASPFEITLPSNLLDTTTTTETPNRRSRLSATAPTSLDLAGLTGRGGEGAFATRVSLREGEELLRTGGTGAVIKRVRG